MPVLPEYDLTGKTAILATSGGGEAPFLAQALVEAGSSVFAVARTQALLDAVSASLPSGSGGAVMDAGVPGSAMAVFLASAASDYMTGEMFIADGGGLAAGIYPTGDAPVIPLEA